MTSPNNSEMSPERQNRVELHPVVANKDTGEFLNVHLLHDLLPIYEEYHGFFEDDAIIGPEDDYKTWLAQNLTAINSAFPWVFAVTVNGTVQGGVWAYNWDGTGEGYFSVQIAGMARRKVHPDWTANAIHQILSMIFEKTNVEIVRCEVRDDNRPARLACLRAGMCHPEPRRGLGIKGGEMIHGVVYSVTRAEFTRQDPDNEAELEGLAHV